MRLEETRAGLELDFSPDLRKRLIAARNFVRENPTAKIAIIGGRRSKPDSSEAVIARSWLQLLDPDTASRCLWVLADSRYTAGDITDLVGFLQQTDYHGQTIGRLAVVSHPDHVELIKLTFGATEMYLPVDTIDSGERPPYGSFELAILRWVYRHDPKWEGWLSWPLRALANRRGRKE